MWYLIVSTPDLCTLTYFVAALLEGSECQRRDVGFDVYREVAIKQDERDNRSEDAETGFNYIAPSHQLQL